MLGKYFKNKNLKIIVGAGGTIQKGFVSTDVDTLDIRNWWHWRRVFLKDGIRIILAEHVLEHLSVKDNLKAMDLAYKYLKPGGVFRIAIPDKNRKDKKYVKAVKPPKDGHISYMNVTELTKMLQKAGFDVFPLEYCDDKGVFHHKSWEGSKGLVYRSYKYDKQKEFWNGKHHYTSLIVDAVKPSI